MPHDKLIYREGDQFLPIPSGEQGLQTVVASPWYKVSDDFLQLEGLCFNREGDLFFLDVFGGQICKLSLSKMTHSLVYDAGNYLPAAIKIHKNGRLFICCLGDTKAGCLFSIEQDGSDFQMIIPKEAGYVIDDMVFDSDGGFYFTHFVGFFNKPIGGVFYVSPDFKTITPVLENLQGPNGVALSVNEKRLWVTETTGSRLSYAELEDDRVSLQPWGASVAYHFTGLHGGDSVCIDADDNVYVAMYGQARVLVFNRYGFPIGQILIPGRETGHHKRTTHPAFIPGTDDLIICTNDEDQGEGSWLFKTKGYGNCHQHYQFK